MELCEEARLRGNDAYARREWDAAIAAYGAGISARAAAGLGADRRLFSNRAAAYVSKYLAVRDAGLVLRGLLALAVNDATAATAVSPSWPKGWYRLYVAHAAASDGAAAAAAVRRGLAHCPGDPDLTRAAQELCLSTPNVHGGSATVYANVTPGDDARRAADAAFRRGEWRVAIEGYTKSIAEAEKVNAPPDRRAYSNRSAAWLRLAIQIDRPSAFRAAIRDAKVCIEIDPAWPKAWYRMASAYLEDGRPARARHVFQQGLTRCPGDGDLRAGLLQANRVIDEGGAETDWEDDDANRANSSPDTSADASPAATAAAAAAHSLDGDEEEEQEEEESVHNAPRVSSVRTSLRSALEDEYGDHVTDDDDDDDEEGDGDGNHMYFGKVRTLGMGTSSARNSRFRASQRPISAPASYAEAFRPPSQEDMLRHSHVDNAFLDKLSPRKHVAPTPVGMHVLRRSSMDRPSVPVHQHARSATVTANTTTTTIPAPTEHYFDALKADIVSSEEDEGQEEGERGNAAGEGEEEGEEEEEQEQEDSLSSSEDGRNPSKNNRENESGRGMRIEQEDAKSDDTQQEQQQQQHAHQQQTLYELLRVKPDASEAAIKRAYYMLARQYHPDKNPDDPAATTKFQKLADAYRVLSNAKSRALYDKYGERDLLRNGVEAVDPSTLFAMVFGCDQFSHLVGELQLASLASNVDDETGNAPAQSVLDEIQQRRIGRLAVELIHMVRPWVNGEKRAFMVWARQETKRLSEANFGPALLYTVGTAYVQRASMALGKKGMFFGMSISAAVHNASYKTKRMNAQLKATAAASRIMHKQRRLHDRVMKLGKGGKAMSEHEAQKIAVDMAENAVDMMWKISVLDIQKTLADVVDVVLSGKDLAFDELSSVAPNSDPDADVDGEDVEHEDADAEADAEQDQPASSAGNGWMKEQLQHKAHVRRRRRRGAASAEDLDGLGEARNVSEEQYGKFEDTSGSAVSPPWPATSRRMRRRKRANASAVPVLDAQDVADGRPLREGECAESKSEIMAERARGIREFGKILMAARRPRQPDWMAAPAGMD